MPASRAQKVRLGLFGVSAAAAAALVLIVFGGLRFWQRHDRYVIDFADSVLGLEKGAPVTFGGIKVGTVDSIRVAPDDLRKVRVTVEINTGTPVRVDTTATLTMAGLTGLKSIDLHGGDVGAARLPPGGTIAVGETTLDRFERQAKVLVDQSQELLGHANKVVANLEALTDPGQFEGVADLLASAQAATANLAGAGAELRGLVAESRAPLRRTLASADHVAGQARTLVDGEVPRVLGGAGSLVDELRGVVRDDGPYLRSAMFDLRQAARSFKELARDLKQRPSRLLFAKPSRERSLP